MNRLVNIDPKGGGLLRRVHDFHEIGQVLHRYCLALEAKAPGLLRECFSVDARIELAGLDEFSIEAYIDICKTHLQRLDATRHEISAPLLELSTGRCSSRCDFVAKHGRHDCGPDPFLTIGGWYDDDWRCIDDEWKIVRRVGVATWCDGNPDVLDGRFLPGACDWLAKGKMARIPRSAS